MYISGIVLVRIDDRLIHGQVMTSWLNYTGANKIMIIDDESAVDPFMKSVFKTCVPDDVKVAAFTVAKAIPRLKKGFQKDKCIILVKFPKTLYELMESGIIFEHINIGGMGIRGTRKKFYKNISASEEERGMLKALIEKGSKVSVRIVADDTETDVATLV